MSKKIFLLKFVSIKYILFVFFLMAHCFTRAQEKFTIIPCETEQDVVNIVDTIFLKGLREKGLVSNIQFVGAPESMGRFYNGDSTGFSRGIIMTTSSDVKRFEGPNESYVVTDGNSGYQDDPDISLITGFSKSTDISHIEFDFIPSGDYLSFNYIWGSDSYNIEVSPSPSSNIAAQETFAFFCSGPEIIGPFSNNASNIALLPGMPPDEKDSYVTLYNLHCGQEGDFFEPPPGKKVPPEGYHINCDLLVWNDHFVGTPNAECYSELNCYSVPFTAERDIIPCETYHIKLIIADNGGGLFDAAVLLEANSFNIGQPEVSVNFTRPFIPEKVLYECNDAEVRFELEHDWEEDIKIPLRYENVVIGEDILKDEAELYGVDTIRIPPGVGYGVSKIKSLKPELGEGDYVRVRYPQNTCANYYVEYVDVPFGSYEPLAVQGLVNGVDMQSTEELNVNCEQEVNMQASASGDFPPYNYVWNFVDSKPDPNDPSKYIQDPKSITETSGSFIARFPQDIQLEVKGRCEQPANQKIQLLIDGLNLQITPESQEVCPGTTLTLTAITEGEVAWSTGATSKSIEVTITEDITYTCSVLNNCTGDPLEESVTFTVIRPFAEIIGKTELCPKEESVLSANEGISYQWESGETTQEINIQPEVNTWYKVKVENTCGDFAKDSVFVKINTSIVADAGEDVEICQGEEVALYGEGGETIEWWSQNEMLSEQRDITVNPQESQAYILIAKGACTDQDTVLITVHDQPKIQTEDILTSGCSPLQVEILSYSGEGGTENLEHFWWMNQEMISQDQDLNVIVDNPGTYDLAFKVTTDFGCYDSLMMPEKIKVHANPESNILSDEYPDYFTGKTYIFTTENLQEDWDCQWLVEENTLNTDHLQYQFKESGDFQVTLIITDANDCSFEKTLSLEVKDLNSKLSVPTAFSPNGDHLNDEFYVVAAGLDNYECNIFNRWGQHIYHSKDEDARWDGRFKGNLVPSGTYVVKINYTGIEGKDKEYRGVLVVL